MIQVGYLGGVCMRLGYDVSVVIYDDRSFTTSDSQFIHLMTVIKPDYFRRHRRCPDTGEGRLISVVDTRHKSLCNVFGNKTPQGNHLTAAAEGHLNGHQRRPSCQASRSSRRSLHSLNVRHQLPEIERRLSNLISRTIFPTSWPNVSVLGDKTSDTLRRLCGREY